MFVGDIYIYAGLSPTFEVGGTHPVINKNKKMCGAYGFPHALWAPSFQQYWNSVVTIIGLQVSIKQDRKELDEVITQNSSKKIVVIIIKNTQEPWLHYKKKNLLLNFMA